MNKCALCGKTTYETATFAMVFDAYCIHCRGLFNFLTKVKKFSEFKAAKVIKTIYGEHDRLPLGDFQMEGFERRTIRLQRER